MKYKKRIHASSHNGTAMRFSTHLVGYSQKIQALHSSTLCRMIKMTDVLIT